MSTTTHNIVIPGPVEGVIRSAQMTDKIAPENSAQLGVNVNFDRIGAFQTRLGVTAYSPGLSSTSITSLGFLLNQNTGNFWILAQAGTSLQYWPGSGSFVSMTPFPIANKARYAQLLNRIYIVNGNASIGGARCKSFDGTVYGDYNTGYSPVGSQGFIGTVSIGSGGTGYSVSDVLTIVPGVGDYLGQVQVLTVDGSGVILTIGLFNNGSGAGGVQYAVASGIATVGGSGTGATINVLTILGAGIPAGDFIQAGFDKRIWVADASIDTVYWTNQYSNTGLITTGDPVNTACGFFTLFSPQDGQTITALHRVPKALLVFKQNNIWRIYAGGLNGSADTYPAFNVGTYSQESIVEAKDGVYFHHSSGFYRFNYNSYNSQPTEISRRIRDFVQAIPRSYYGSITASYDGFDAITWNIGPVTVEGVTYSNCAVRFSIATQIWTIYDYPVLGLTTAAINFNNLEVISQLVATNGGAIGIKDSGGMDFGNPIYYEEIDRWRSFTEMWAHQKNITGMAAFSLNGAGALYQYQTDADLTDTWHDIGKYKDSYTSLFPNLTVENFSKIRTRVTGVTSGPQIIFDGQEIITLQDLGYAEN